MNDDLVLLEKFYDPGVAHITSGFLQSNGINSYIIDDQITTIQWPWQFATGGTRLMVRSDDYNAAKELLEIFGSESDNQPLLPTKKKERVKGLFWIFLFLISGLLPGRKRPMRDDE